LVTRTLPAGVGEEEEEEKRSWGQEEDWLQGLAAGLLARSLQPRDIGLSSPVLITHLSFCYFFSLVVC
jgi:hypothetical protein